MFSRRQTMGQFVDHHTMCDTLHKPVGSFVHAQKIGVCSYTHTQFSWAAAHVLLVQSCDYRKPRNWSLFTTVQGNLPPFVGVVWFTRPPMVHVYPSISSLEWNRDQLRVMSVHWYMCRELACSYIHNFSWRAAAHMLTN